MSKRLKVEDAAQADLRAAIFWYEEKLPGLGAEFYYEVQRGLSLIKRNPGVGGLVPKVRVLRKYKTFSAASFSFQYCLP